MKKLWCSTWRQCSLFISVAILFSQTQHLTPYTGAWKLNLAKSTYPPGTAPRSQTLRFTPEGKNIVSGVGEKGTSYEWAIPWSNGKEVPVEGLKNVTAIQTIRGHALDMTLKEAGKTITVVHDVMSPDGKTHSGTITNLDEEGRSNQHLEFYEKIDALSLRH